MKKHHSFGVQLVSAFVLFFIIGSLAMSVLLFRNYQSKLMDTNEHIYLDALEVSTRKMQEKMSSAYLTAQEERSKRYVEQYLLNNDYDTENMRILARYYMMSELSEAITGMSALNGLLFFREDGSAVGTTDTWRILYENGAHPFYTSAELASIRDTGVHWLGGYWVEDFTLTETKISKTFSKYIMIVGASHYRYTSASRKEPKEIVQLISLRESALRECYEYLLTDGNVTLLDAQGHQLSDGENPLSLGEIPWFYSLLDENAHSGNIEASYNHAQWQIVYVRMPETGWILAKQIPFEVYQSPLNSMRRMTFVIVCGLVVCFAALYILWTRKFLRPLHKISKGLEEVRNGDMSVRLTDSTHTRELELMRSEFNAMLDSISQLIANEKCMERERVELEIQNLQMRLNPHMVFNTISSIRWMAMLNGSDVIADMLVELVELIRPIFQEWQLSWKLSDELVYLDHYIKLMKLRTGGMPMVTMDIVPEARDVKVPCYVLQPLFENSCEYGRDGNKPLHIHLTCRMENGDIILRVCDDGRGIAPDRYAKLIERMQRPIDRAPQEIINGHSGIGLYSIHRRIQIQYGEQYGIQIVCRPEGGTEITIRFAAENCIK